MAADIQCKVAIVAGLQKKVYYRLPLRPGLVCVLQPLDATV